MVSSARRPADGQRDASRLQSSSLSAVSSLMGLQLFSRLFTFTLNQALYRLASPKVFGTAAIQFELVSSTILFISREGVRGALLRTWPRQDAQADHLSRSTSIRNVALLPLIFGIPFACVVGCVYWALSSTDAKNQPNFTLALGGFLLAAIVELASEPMHNRAMVELRTGVRVRAEGLGIIGKTISTFLALLYDSSQNTNGQYALLAFSLGQLSYSIAVLGVYSLSFNIFDTKHLKDRNEQRPTFDSETCTLSLTMSSQSVVKHFLTEGDKLVLSALSPLQDQGGYAVAVNYGSLIARIVFQPIEEMCRVYFSTLLEQSDASKATSRANLRQAASAILTLLSVQLTGSLVLITFGPTYLPIVLRTILPSQYLETSAPAVLAAWIWLLPVMAVNGGLEAFHSSAASTDDLNRQSRWMIAFSVVYIATAAGLYSLGFDDTSLVYANILNLGARIVYTIHFMRTYFRRRNGADLLAWRHACPPLVTCVTCFCSFGAISLSRTVLQVDHVIEHGQRPAILSRAVLTHVVVGGATALLVVASWWISAGRLLVRSKQLKES